MMPFSAELDDDGWIDGWMNVDKKSTLCGRQKKEDGESSQSNEAFGRTGRLGG